MSYYPWTHESDDPLLAWAWDTPRELMENRKSYLLREGVPCQDWFPKDLVFELSKEHGSKVADSIPNTDRLLIVSEKLKGILDREAPDNPIEFLPVRLRSPKKKVLPAQYFIANILGSVRCMDEEKSDFRMDAISKHQVDRVRRLVLDEKRIPKNAKIFRLAEKTNLVLVREDLGQYIVDEDCAGMFFVDLEDFGSEFR